MDDKRQSIAQGRGKYTTHYRLGIMRKATKAACAVASFIFVVFVFGQYQRKLYFIEERETAQFKKWINSTVGDIERRRLHWFKRHDEREEPYRRLPNLVGIGVRKCGTGALENFIGQHPWIQIAIREAHFYDRNRKEGLDFYRSRMPLAFKHQWVAEKTPAYFRSRPAELPDIINRDLPEVKLWVILCNPVQRAFSDYVMRQKRKKNKISEAKFEQYVDAFMPPVQRLFRNWSSDSELLWNHETVFAELEKDVRSDTFAHGLYAYYIKRWLKVFAPERFFITDGEELLNDPGKIVEGLQDFLRIPKLLRSTDFIRHPQTGLFCIRPWWQSDYDFRAEYERRSSWQDSLVCSIAKKGLTRANNSSYTLPKNLQVRLQKFYAPYNQKLFEMLGREFAWGLD